MKKILSILSIGLSMLALSYLTTGCVEEIPEVVEELELSNMLTPSSISGLVDSSTGTTVTFTWTNSNAVIYYLEVYGFKTGDADTPATVEDITEDMLAAMEPAFTAYVEPSESGSSTSYTKEDLEPEMSYYARVCAQSSADPEAKTAGDSKWAYVYPIDTYSEMDQLPSFSVKERTSTTITVQWTVAEGDTDGINQIRVTPHPTDASQAFLRVDVEAGATEATIGSGEIKLNPSERYTVVLHYNSANRGQIVVWTRPETGSAVRVTSLEHLQQLLTSGDASETGIIIPYSETAYAIGEIELAHPQKIYGEESVDGSKPVLTGALSLKTGATSLHLEALEFDGNAYNFGTLISIKETYDISSISVLNCDIHGYSKGLYSAPSGVAAPVETLSFEGCMVYDIEGNGGDNIDIRDASTIGTLTVKNSTLYNGFRTIFRIDAAATVNSLVFDHNTVSNICYVDNKDNNGIFHIRATAPSISVTNNIFMNISGAPETGSESVIVSANSASKAPTAVSGNYYYNVGEAFWNPDKLTETQGIAGGGAVLSSDPCENSARGIFNITDAAVSNAEAGDPRWLVEYVPEPMADLEPVQPGDEWVLNSTSTYGKNIEETTVIENTKFIVTSNPINVLDEGMEFSAEATLEYSGVPVDCAIAFMADSQGSIFASALRSDSGTVNDHITVAVGPADGSSATVVGAIPVGAYNQKVVFDDIEGETLIYLYACGPVVLSGLEWSDDVNTGSSALADPEVKADESTAGALTLSWQPVENAESYIISFGTKEPDAEYDEDEYIIDNVTATSYTWENFPSGTYTVNVQAVPAEPEKFTNSLIIGTTVTVTAPALTNMSSGSLTQDDFSFLAAVVGNKVRWPDTQTVTYKNFFFSNTEKEKVSFGVDDSFGSYHNGNGSGKPNVDPAQSSRTIQFKAAGNGKLEIIASSTTTGKDARVGYTVNGVKDEESRLSSTLPEKPSAPITEPNAVFDVTVNAGDVIDIYSKENVYIMSVTWTPAATGEGIPFDENAINEAFTANFSDQTVYVPESFEEMRTTSDKLTWGAASGKKMTFDSARSAGGRIKFEGGSDSDGSTIPTNRYMSFKTTKPGTIALKLISSGSAEGRAIHVILAKKVGEEQIVVPLYTADAVADGEKDNTSAVQIPIDAEDLAGTTSTAVVYIFGTGGGVNLYEFGFTPAE